MKNRIIGVTIAQNGEVSYERQAQFREREYVNERQKARSFPWAALPSRTPVIDMRGACIKLIWNAILSHDHPSFDAKLDAARKAGLKVTSAGVLARRGILAPW